MLYYKYIINKGYKIYYKYIIIWYKYIINIYYKYKHIFDMKMSILINHET